MSPKNLINELINYWGDRQSFFSPVENRKISILRLTWNENCVEEIFLEASLREFESVQTCQSFLILCSRNERSSTQAFHIPKLLLDFLGWAWKES